MLQPTQAQLTLALLQAPARDLTTVRPVRPVRAHRPGSVRPEAGRRPRPVGLRRRGLSPLGGPGEVSQDVFDLMMRLWVQAAKRSPKAPLADPAAALDAARDILLP